MPAMRSLQQRSPRPTTLRAASPFQQQRIHLLSELDPATYHVLEVARLRGSLDVDALGSSIATICERHNVLRSHFFVQRGEPRQRVGTTTLRLEHVAIERCSAPKRMAAIRLPCT